MYRDEHTGGAVVITQVANGFCVTLPRKAADPYAGLVPAIREVRKQQEDDLAEFRGDDQGDEKTEPGFEMLPVNNIFIFKKWDQVLTFLTKQLSPVAAQ